MLTIKVVLTNAMKAAISAVNDNHSNQMNPNNDAYSSGVNK
jgi:hypothetical protein